MGDESIWKKEITLGRKRKPAGDGASSDSGGKVPFWKKELGGKKKAKAAAAAEPMQDSSEPRPAPQPVPFWKKEITLGGGKKPSEPKAPKEPNESSGDEVPFWKRDLFAPKVERLNDADGTAFLKKELTRKQQREVDRLAEEASRSVAPAPPEIHEPIKAAEAAAAALIADPNAEIEIFFQAPRARAAEAPADEAAPSPETASAAEAADPSAAETEPAAPAAPAADAAPSLPLAPPVPRESESSAPESVRPYEPYRPQQPASPPPAIPGVPTPVEHVTAPGLEPLPEVPALDVEIPAAAASEPPAPAAPAAPAPATPAPGVHPPVPAAELPPLPAEPKVPWWKKEIGGAKKSSPAAASAPTAAATAPTAAASAPTAAPTEEKVPFWKKEIGGKKKDARSAGGEVSIWKKEISFSRKAKPVGDAGANVATPAGENVPFWKKELSLSRKAKPAAAAAAAATATTAAVAEEKVPFWKKEIGGKKKGAAQSKAAGAKAPKAKKAGGDVPFWKRDLSVKSLKQAQVSRASRSAGKDAAAAQKKAHAKSKRLVGLKVGASQIAAARVVNNGVAELVQLARQPLEQGIVVGGELRDPDALAAQLKTFFTRNKLPKKGVRLGIASNRIGVRIFDVAGVADDKQLGNAIQFRAQEALPIPLDEAVLDYHVLGESVDAEGQPVKRILLVVAYRELVDRYVTACRKAGITLTGIDLEAFALLRALAAPRPEDEPAKAALVGVAIGHDRSTFAVSDGRVCEFTRVLEWGGSALNIAMARALDLAPSEVEGYKRSLMLDGPAPVPEGLSQEQWSAALEAVRRQLQSFARELVSSLQFYQNQPGSLGIGEIVVAGGTAHMPGLAEELQRLIGVHVRVGDPLARVRVARKLGNQDQIGSLAIAIGLGIED